MSEVTRGRAWGGAAVFTVAAVGLLVAACSAWSPGVRLHFKVDPTYLVLHTLENDVDRAPPGELRAQLEAFKARARAIDEDAYSYLQHKDYTSAALAKAADLPPACFPGGAREAALVARAGSLASAMQHDPQFATIQDQTVEAAARVQREWESDLPRTSRLMADLTGLHMDVDLDVLVTHPGQRNGVSYVEEGSIGWSDARDFPHYNTIYLWHEVLHHFIRPTVPPTGQGYPAHAIIELLTDNELHVRLNGGTYPPFVGHPEDQPYEEQLQDEWQAYLRNPHRNALEFLHQAEARCIGK